MTIATENAVSKVYLSLYVKADNEKVCITAYDGHKPSATDRVNFWVFENGGECQTRIEGNELEFDRVPNATYRVMVRVVNADKSDYETLDVVIQTGVIVDPPMHFVNPVQDLQAVLVFDTETEAIAAFRMALELGLFEVSYMFHEQSNSFVVRVWKINHKERREIVLK